MDEKADEDELSHINIRSLFGIFILSVFFFIQVFPRYTRSVDKYYPISDLPPEFRAISRKLDNWYHPGLKVRKTKEGLPKRIVAVDEGIWS